MLTAQATGSPLQGEAGGDGLPAKKMRALNAAAAVFAHKGYHGATTQDIAAAMGIQQGSLYYHFKSKQDALRQVCEFGINSYWAKVENIFARPQPFEAKLYAVVAAHLTSYRESIDALKVHNDQRLYLPEEDRHQLKEVGSRYRRYLERLLIDAQAEREVRSDLNAHFMAYSIIGVCNAWGSNLVRDDAIDLYQTIDQCAELIMRGMVVKA